MGYNTTNLKIHNDLNNSIQSIDNIDLEFSDGNLLNDNSGPAIIIYQNENQLLNNSIIYPPYNITISLDDNFPINISGLNYHDIRIWIDNNQNESIILNDLFIPTSNTTGYINYIIDENLFYQDSHTINIEAWDILNNFSSISYDINIFNNNNENIIYNVYNFPNPFKESTYFTFSYINSNPINININIYNLNGEKINTISQYLETSNNHFYKIHWDGLDKFSRNIPNGIYLYELEILQGNTSLHKKIYKLAKSK